MPNSIIAITQLVKHQTLETNHDFLNNLKMKQHNCLYYNNACTVFLNIPQDPKIIWDANISLSVIFLSPFIGTFILWDVDNGFRIAPPA